MREREGCEFLISQLNLGLFDCTVKSVTKILSDNPNQCCNFLRLSCLGLHLSKHSYGFRFLQQKHVMPARQLRVNPHRHRQLFSERNVVRTKPKLWSYQPHHDPAVESVAGNRNAGCSNYRIVSCELPAWSKPRERKVAGAAAEVPNQH